MNPIDHTFRSTEPELIYVRKDEWERLRAELSATREALQRVEAEHRRMSDMVFGKQAEGAWYVLDHVAAALSGPVPTKDDEWGNDVQFAVRFTDEEPNCAECGVGEATQNCRHGCRPVPTEKDGNE